jgi:chemotaxis protein CheD
VTRAFSIRTVLGSCVSITLWHPVKRVGGMCHFLLPTRGVPVSEENSMATTATRRWTSCAETAGAGCGTPAMPGQNLWRRQHVSGAHAGNGGQPRGPTQWRGRPRDAAFSTASVLTESLFGTATGKSFLTSARAMSGARQVRPSALQEWLPKPMHREADVTRIKVLVVDDSAVVRQVVTPAGARPRH